jgi:hypothetical protein
MTILLGAARRPGCAPHQNGEQKSWRRCVASSSNRSHYDVYRWARLAPRWCNPKPLAHIPDLTDSNDHPVARTNPERAHHFAVSIWPSVADKTRNSVAKPVPMPAIMVPRRVTYSSKQDTDEKEVTQCIKVLQNNKSQGFNGLRCDAIKTGRHELVPVLTIIFRAALKPSYHPSNFNGALTTIAPRSADRDLSKTKSYRPIALLDHVGKIYDRIIKNRLNILADDHKMIPNLQFGTTGKCTTRALQHLCNTVHDGWRGKSTTTLMSLDIAGAFDYVDREKLIEVLLQKGVPDWLGLLAGSFLEDRGTVLQFPGNSSRPYWVNSGIPQESLLSPIMFLFASCGILKDFSRHSRYNVEVQASAYIDDTYLTVNSPSYDINCSTLKAMHDELMEWSALNKMTFSPEKYSVHHFREPEARGPACMLLPDIPGLEANKKKILIVPKMAKKRQRVHRPVPQHSCSSSVNNTIE